MILFQRLRAWADNPKAAIVKGLLFAAMAAVLVGIVLLLLWIDSWWPERLIPWIPFDRV